MHRVNRWRSRGFTLVELLVVIAIIGILVALLLPAVQAAREAARRAQCQSNIKNVALAVLNYESAHDTLPVGTLFPNVDQRGNPSPTVQGNTEFTESWMTLILPYLENQPLHDALIFVHPTSGADVPMKDPLNFDERGTEIPVLLCPTDSNNRVKYIGHGGNWARGNYAASVGLGATHTLPQLPNQPPGIVGPNSCGWNGISPSSGAPCNPEGHHLSRGVMGPNCASTLAQITDGTSKTVLLGEIRTGIFEGDPRGTWAFGHAGGNLLAFYGWGGDDNGPNYCGPNSDDIGGVGFTCQGNAQLQAECMTCFGPGAFDQATARSMHVGGVFVALCDGSVQFISDDIETGGSNARCCRAWDHLVLSQDSLDPGGTVRRTPPPN